MKLLLTSAGFENKRIAEIFLALAGKRPENIKAVFIPTAAVNADAIEVLPKCLHDLLDCGIPKENIRVYDLHKKMTLEELKGYDAVYVCGGDTGYLLDRIDEQDFRSVLLAFIEQGGVYVGVSAGSQAAAGNLKNSFGYPACTIHVHCSEGMSPGPVDRNGCRQLRITNNQAVLVTDGMDIRIVE